ncbi:MAG: hypothetical protein H7X76_04445 [Prolixibacteraceae bacterium]|nr:hypothetical protein [Burkholderiales bacterium]
MAVCLLAATSGAAVSRAEEAAVIRNRAFAHGGGKEVDAAVRMVAVDSVPVGAKLAQVRIAAGTRAIEVVCTARVLAGMGTVDFDSISVLTVQVAGGRSYQLEARVSVQGDCAPFLE